MGYSTDLTADEFAQIADLLPARSHMGRPAWNAHLIINAIFYIVKMAASGVYYPKIFHHGRPFMDILESGNTQDYGFSYMNASDISFAEDLAKIPMLP